MRGQIRGLNQAIRNAQDAISLIQTAEGALNETHAILQRMRELAVQAASDTNTDEDRQAIQEEIDQLMEELTRIGNTTEFNTKTLLDGTFVGTFHIGANENQNISLTIAKMDADELLGAGPTPATGYLEGVTFTAVASGEAGNDIQIVFKDPEAEEAELSISVSGNIITVSLATDEDGNITSTAADIVNAINTDTEASALVTASVGTEPVSIDDATSVALSGGNDGESATPATGGLAGVTFTAVDPGEAGNSIEIVFEDPEADEAVLSISVDGNKITVTLATDGEGDITSTIDDIVAAINGNNEANALVTASGSGTGTVSTGSVELSGGNDGASATPATGKLAGVTFTAVTPGEAGDEIEIEFVDPGEADQGLKITVDNNKITVYLATDDEGKIISTAAQIAAAINNDENAKALVTASVGTEAVSIGDETSVTVTLSGGNDGASATSSVDVTTQTGANKAIQTIQTALDKVSGERSKLGALQNRLEHTINNLSVAAENLTAAESRIRDVDMAKEMMEFTKNQILIQAGTAMLANANVRPQSVLQLLG